MTEIRGTSPTPAQPLRAPEPTPEAAVVTSVPTEAAPAIAADRAADSGLAEGFDGDYELAPLAELETVVPMATTAAPATTEPAVIPADGDPNYYKKRYDDFVARNPGVTPPDYYLGYGDKYASRFTNELKPHLSADGQAWLDRARQNLQKEIEAERAKDPVAFAELERNPDKFREFAYKTHAKAYLDAGLADLPIEDLLKIGVTPDFRDLFTEAGLDQVGDVADDLIVTKLQQLTGSPRDAVQHTLDQLKQSPDHLNDVLALLKRGDNGKVLLETMGKLLVNPVGTVISGAVAVGGVIGKTIGGLFDR